MDNEFNLLDLIEELLDKVPRSTSIFTEWRERDKLKIEVAEIYSRILNEFNTLKSYNDWAKKEIERLHNENL